MLTYGFRLPPGPHTVAYAVAAERLGYPLVLKPLDADGIVAQARCSLDIVWAVVCHADLQNGETRNPESGAL